MKQYIYLPVFYLLLESSQAPLIKSTRLIPSQPPSIPTTRKIPPPFGLQPSVTPSQPPAQVFRPSQPLATTLRIRIPPPFIPRKERERRVSTEPKPPTKPFFGPPKKIKKLVKPLKKQPGYFAFYKRRGKFIKINKRPLTKFQARDLGADVVDHSLANTFKFVKTKRKVKTANLLVRKNYFIATRNKYRGFKIRKGKRIKLKNKFIEVRGRPRLDTIQEVNRIQADRYIASLRKQKLRRLKPIKFRRV